MNEEMQGSEYLGTEFETEYEDWYNTISAYDKSFKKWEGRASKIVDRYRDSSRQQNNPEARFNILWSKNIFTKFINTHLHLDYIQNILTAKYLSNS